MPHGIFTCDIMAKRYSIMSAQIQPAMSMFVYDLELEIRKH